MANLWWPPVRNYRMRFESKFSSGSLPANTWVARVLKERLYSFGSLDLSSFGNPV